MKRAPRLIGREELPAEPQQARSIARRAKLLEAARVLFAEKGYDATSIEEITSRAEAAAGAFYTYFRSKRQLLVVMMNDLLQRLASIDLQPDGDLRDFLTRIFRTDLRHFGVIRAWQEATLSDPELAPMRADIEAWTEQRILAVFEALQKRPHARRDADLPTFARMMDRHFWSLLARGASLSKKAFVREITVAADVIHRYLFREP
jgi:AcrR family transcriptional regulator